MYELFYGLTRRPFQLMPDRQFLFPSTGHKRALSYLLYGLEQREGFVVITGDVGTGKTLLIQTLFAELSGRPLVTARLAAANLDSESVLPMVAAAFGLPYEGRSKAALLQAIETTLRSDPAYREGALLVVDEAQTFSHAALEELRILSNLELGGEALIQLFLVGQTELRRVLADRSMVQLRQRVIASHHLEPLTLDESRDYIIYRLRAAGWSGEPLIEPEVLEAVHQRAAGVPRRINWIMDRLFLFGYLEERPRFELADVQTVIEELDNELQGEAEHLTEVVPDAPADNHRLAALEARVAVLEQALRFQLAAPAPSDEKSGSSASDGIGAILARQGAIDE